MQPAFPPIRSDFSNTVTENPCVCSSRATMSPASPPPATTTDGIDSWMTCGEHYWSRPGRVNRDGTLPAASVEEAGHRLDHDAPARAVDLADDVRDDRDQVLAR